MRPNQGLTEAPRQASLPHGCVAHSLIGVGEGLHRRGDLLDQPDLALSRQPDRAQVAGVSP